MPSICCQKLVHSHHLNQWQSNENGKGELIKSWVVTALSHSRQKKVWKELPVVLVFVKKALENPFLISMVLEAVDFWIQDESDCATFVYPRRCSIIILR